MYILVWIEFKKWNGALMVMISDNNIMDVNVYIISIDELFILEF